MKNVLKIAALGAAIVASPAFAGVTITGSVDGSAATYAAPKGSTSVITFNTDSLTAEAASKGFKVTTSGTARQASGYVFGVDSTRNDFFAPEPSDGSGYFGVGANSTLELLGTVAQSSVSVFAGSLDSYNVVTLLDAAGRTIGNFTGTQIAGFVPPFPGTAASSSNRRVTFTADAGSAIYGVRFSNSDSMGSFEFDNVAFTAAVPEPATWAMMLVGFGMVGAASRYRRRSMAATIA